MKKFLAILLALVMMLSMTTTVWATDPTVGSFSAACMQTVTDTRIRLSGEMTNVSNTGSTLEIKLYSADELIATTTLINSEYIDKNVSILSYNFVISGEASSSWNTVWEAQQPDASMKPDEVVLYIDGKKVANAEVHMYKNNDRVSGEEYTWSALNGVTTYAAKLGDTKYATLQAAIEQAQSGDTIYLWSNNSEAAVTLPVGVALDNTKGYTLTNAPKAPAGYVIAESNGVYTVMSATTSRPSGGGSSRPAGHEVTSPFDGVDKVYVDNVLVDAVHYTVYGGDVVLKQSFMDTLKAGNHTVKLVYGDREATGSFTVKTAGKVESAPTGDLGVALYGMMALSSALGAAYVTGKKY